MRTLAIVLSVIVAAAAVFVWREHNEARVERHYRELRAAFVAGGPPSPELQRAIEQGRVVVDRELTDGIVACDCRALLADYETSPAVTAALARRLERDPAAKAALDARPHTHATLDVLIAAWRPGRSPALVPVILAYDYRWVEDALGADDARLLLCQADDCHPTDLEALVRIVRKRVTDRAGDDDRDDVSRLLPLGPDEAWPAVTRLSHWLTAERRAFVTIGKPALPSLWPLFDAPSRALWSFAALTAAEIDPAAFLEHMDQALKSRIPGRPQKAVVALSAAVDAPGADIIYGRAAAHRVAEVAAYALKAAHRR